MKTILTIYSEYTIPPNLQRHMFEVAAVGRYVVDHWKTGNLDKDLVTKTLLLHDMANIIKFRPPFLGWSEDETVHWLAVQKQFVEKYGSDHHKANEVIIQEIDPPEVEKVVETSLCIGWHHGDKEPSWEGRVCDFADCSVSPKGIVGFEARIADLLQRYHKVEDEGVQRSRINAQQLREYVTVDLDELPDVNFDQEI